MVKSRVSVAVVLAAALTTWPASDRLIAQDPGPGWRRATTGPGVIIGQVRDRQSGQAVPRAIVRLSNDEVDLTRVADRAGRFFFHHLPAGGFSLEAFKHGYLDGAFGRVRPEGSGVRLDVFPEQWITDIAIDLFRAATISGVVLDEHNEPVPDVQVESFRREISAGREYFRRASSVRTDDRGLYRLHELIPGDYLVAVPAVEITIPLAALTDTQRAASEAAADAYVVAGESHIRFPGRSPPPPPLADEPTAYATTYYPAADRQRFSTPLTVAGGEVRAGVTLQIRAVPAGRITGYVLGPDGPVRDQVLSLFADVEPGRSGELVAATTTDPSGAFSFPRVPIGRYAVVAGNRVARLLTSPLEQLVRLARPGASEVTVPGQPLAPERGRWGRATVSVSANTSEATTVTLTPGIRIAGRLEFEGDDLGPGEDALTLLHVSLESPTGEFPEVAPTRVGPDGSFEFTGVAPNQYFIRLLNPPAGWAFARTLSGGLDVSAEPLTTREGRDVTDVRVVITSHVTEIAGSARQPNGLPVAGGRVIVMPASRRDLIDYGTTPSRLRSVRANMFGVFSIRGLPPGSYVLAAIDDADAGHWRDPELLARLRRAGTPFTLEPSERRVQDAALVAVR